MLGNEPVWEPDRDAIVLDRFNVRDDHIAETILSATPPPTARTGGSFGFVFDQHGDLLLVRHRLRGWELPGGRLEQGESAFEAFAREIAEEGRVGVENVHLVGFRRNTAIAPGPDHPYATRDTYVCFFIAGTDGTEITDVADEYVEEARFVHPGEVLDENVNVAGPPLWRFALSLRARRRSTARLTLRAPAPTDRRAFADIQLDPRTNVHTPAGAPTAEDVDGFFEGVMDAWRHGLSYWVVEADHRIVGFAGVEPADVLARPCWNLYYRFSPSSWGSGYATEASVEAVRVAAEIDARRPVVARTRATNTPAIEVAERAGLTRRADLDHDDFVVLATHW